MNTLLIGLGNPILSDDGVGWQVAEAVAASAPILTHELHLEIDCLALGGLTLMERMIGYKRVILVDALCTGQAAVGTVTAFPLEALPERSTNHMASIHDASLQTALQMGRRLGAVLPEKIWIVAVEAQAVYELGDTLSPPVAAAVPRAVQQVLQILQTWEAEDGEYTTSLRLPVPAHKEMP